MVLKRRNYVEVAMKMNLGCGSQHSARILNWYLVLIWAWTKGKVLRVESQTLILDDDPVPLSTIPFLPWKTSNRGFRFQWRPMSNLPQAFLKSSSLFETESCQLEDFVEFSKWGLMEFKKNIIIRTEAIKARRLDKMLSRAFLLLKQSQTIHKPRGRRSTCNFESISCSFKEGFLWFWLNQARNQSDFVEKRHLKNRSKSNSTDITYSTVIESMITILKSRFENCPDSKLQERWEIRIQKMISILGWSLEGIIYRMTFWTSVIFMMVWFLSVQPFELNSSPFN